VNGQLHLGRLPPPMVIWMGCDWAWMSSELPWVRSCIGRVLKPDGWIAVVSDC
jgi:hypothetical protein